MENDKRGGEMYFTYIPLFEPHVLGLLKAFFSMSFYSIDIWCVNQKGLDIIKRSLVRI